MKRQVLAAGLGALAMSHGAHGLSMRAHDRQYAAHDIGAVKPAGLAAWNYTSPTLASYSPATTSPSVEQAVAAAQAQRLVNPADFKRHLAAALAAERHYVTAHGAMDDQYTFRLKPGQYLLLPSTAYPGQSILFQGSWDRIITKKPLVDKLLRGECITWDDKEVCGVLFVPGDTVPDFSLHFYDFHHPVLGVHYRTSGQPRSDPSYRRQNTWLSTVVGNVPGTFVTTHCMAASGPVPKAQGLFAASRARRALAAGHPDKTVYSASTIPDIANDENSLAMAYHTDYGSQRPTHGAPNISNIRSPKNADVEQWEREREQASRDLEKLQRRVDQMGHVATAVGVAAAGMFGKKKMQKKNAAKKNAAPAAKTAPPAKKVDPAKRMRRWGFTGKQDEAAVQRTYARHRRGFGPFGRDPNLEAAHVNATKAARALHQAAALLR